MPLVAVLISALAVPFANADTPKQPDKPADTKPIAKAKINTDDLSTLAELHHVNAMEIELGKLALKRGTSAIAIYAQTMIDDHTSNDKDLVALATKRKTKLPTVKESEEMHAQVSALRVLGGDDFDTAYVAMMVTGHEDVAKKVIDRLGVTTDDDVKTYLTMTKPAVELHAKRARDLQKQLKRQPGT